MDIQCRMLLKKPLDGSHLVSQGIPDELLKRNACVVQKTFRVNGSSNSFGVRLVGLLTRKPAPGSRRRATDPAAPHDLLNFLDLRQIRDEVPLVRLSQATEEVIDSVPVSILQSLSREVLIGKETVADDSLDFPHVESPENGSRFVLPPEVGDVEGWDLCTGLEQRRIFRLPGQWTSRGGPRLVR